MRGGLPLHTRGRPAVPGTASAHGAGSLLEVPADPSRRPMWPAIALVVLAVIVLPAAACGRGQALHLVRVGHATDPVYLTAPPGQAGKLYVVEQAGQIVVLANGKVSSTFLDIQSQVTSGGEQGLLSMAFDPGYAKNHRFYVDYTDQNGDTRVVRYLSNGTTAIASSAKQLLFVKDFAPNHNGGQLQFGPDGRLYWGNGDGGGEGDPNDNGQNLNRPFAKIMRLDVNAARPRWHLVAYGLRNPWRFSFDRKTGDLYIGDVGQDDWEEIDYLRRGYPSIANFGWKHFEGSHVYDAGTALLPTGRYVPPIAEYSHDGGNCAVDGGYVYRGANVPAALGRYFYGDNCTRHRLEPEGREREGDRRAGRAVQGSRTLLLRPGQPRRALPDVRRHRRHLPPRRLSAGLARAAAANLRALVAERRVRERLQRLVEVAQLVRDHRQVVAVLLPAVQPRELLDEPVEPARAAPPADDRRRDPGPCLGI